jgi:MarR-like DNA-binding transcriptional regulator SgrR of sgrS sRNA
LTEKGLFSRKAAKDGKTYTFLLRDNVQFHDGAQLTAEDVKATFDRIVKPPQGISIPRSILFKAVSELNARDKYIVEFKLSEPRPVNDCHTSAIRSGAMLQSRARGFRSAGTIGSCRSRRCAANTKPDR